MEPYAPSFVGQPNSREYVLQDGLVVAQLQPGADPEAIVSELGAATVVTGPPETARALRAAGRICLRIPQSTGLREVVRSLPVRVPSLVRYAAPLYLPRDGGFLSAVIPRARHLAVRLRPDADVEATRAEIEALGFLRNAVSSEILRTLDHFVRQGGADDDGLDLVEAVRALPGVAAAAVDWIKLTPHEATPNDPLLSRQWNLAAVGMPGVWAAGVRGDPQAVIALVDSGLDIGHGDLSGVLTPQATHFDAADALEFDPGPYSVSYAGEPHGTMIAGLIAAEADNGYGVAGMAAGCSLMPVAVDPGSFLEVSVGVSWAALHAPAAVNMSFSCDLDPIGSIADAIEWAWAQGSVLAAAAGNAGPRDPIPEGIRYPASHPLVIAVGATDLSGGPKRDDPSGERWWTPVDERIDVAAPGLGIWTTDARGLGMGWNFLDDSGKGYFVVFDCYYAPAQVGDGAGDFVAVFTGTSAACGHVSALAALLKAQDPARTPAEVRALIEATCAKTGVDVAYIADPAHPQGTWSPEMGYGQVDAEAALLDTSAKERPEPGPDAAARTTPVCGYVVAGPTEGWTRIVLTESLDEVIDIPTRHVARVEPHPGRPMVATAWVDLSHARRLTWRTT